MDLPSSPDGSTGIERAGERSRKASPPVTGPAWPTETTILGDLNLTPRTRGIDQVVPGLEDLFREVASAGGPHWPRRSPVLRIDFALEDRLDVVGLRTFDPGFGGHRGLLLDLGAGQAASDDS